MRTTAALSAAVLTGAVLTALPASPAHASTSSGSVTSSAGLRLPVTNFYQLTVDSRHDHLFFSEGYPDDGGPSEPGMGQGLLVTSFSGKTAATLDAGTEVTGLARRDPVRGASPGGRGSRHQHGHAEADGGAPPRVRRQADVGRRR